MKIRNRIINWSFFGAQGFRANSSYMRLGTTVRGCRRKLKAALATEEGRRCELGAPVLGISDILIPPSG